MKEPIDEILTLQYSKDDQYLAVGTSTGKIRIYNTNTGKLHTNFMASYSLQPITVLRWRGMMPEVLISGSADGCVTYWNVNDKKSFGTLRDRFSDIYSIDISRDENKMAVGCKDFSVKLYDNNKRSLLVSLKPGDTTTIGHSNRVHSVKFTDDPNILVSGGSDNTIHIWDLRTAKSIGYIYGPHICGDTIDVMQDTILTGSFDKVKVLQLWSITKKEVIQDIKWNTENNDCASGYINIAKFEKALRHRYIIASGRAGVNKNEVRIFNNKVNYDLMGKIELNKSATCIDFMNTKQGFAVGGIDGFVNTFNYS